MIQFVSGSTTLQKHIMITCDLLGNSMVYCCLLQVSCSCNSWFAGKNCQINLKLLLIVGAVSASLMMIIACGVSCFCCKDRRKRNIPSRFNP